MTSKPESKAAEKDGAPPLALDKANDQGFIGTKVDPLPNEAYSLETGPDSPTIGEQQAAVKKGDADA